MPVENNRIGQPAQTGPIRPAGAPRRPSRTTTRDGRGFAEVLREAQQAQAPVVQPVKFSGHAQARLESRGIQLSNRDLARIQDGVDKAAGKGGQESLVLIDDLALVVSVRNRTVITVMDGDSRRGNVFTQIDSAVIV